MKGWKKVFHVNGDQKKAGLAILISDKIDFEINITKETKSNGRMGKGWLKKQNKTNQKKPSVYQLSCIKNS